jgi:hypothetical protein
MRTFCRFMGMLAGEDLGNDIFSQVRT